MRIESMRHFLLLLIAVCSCTALVADDQPGVTITVTVTNIPGVKGDLLIGFYATEKSFTKEPLPQSPKIDLTSGDDVTAKISGVMPGTYAIAVVQDLNENGKLDRTVVGMPREPLGFSVISTIPRGKPKFDACAFEVGKKDLEMTIALVVK